MPYPSKPLGDYERAFEMGREIEPPALPMPETIKGTNPQGGAPTLSLPTAASPADWVEPRKLPKGLPIPTPGEGPYWERISLPEPPTQHTLYAPIPWDRKDVEKNWSPVIEQMAESMWQRYQDLPPEQKALPAWQQVAKNPQEAAYTVWARMLANKTGERSRLKQEASEAVRTHPVYRWLQSLGR